LRHLPDEVLIRYVTFYVFYLSMLHVVKAKLIYGRCCCLVRIFNHLLYQNGWTPHIRTNLYCLR